MPNTPATHLEMKPVTKPALIKADIARHSDDLALLKRRPWENPYNTFYFGVVIFSLVGSTLLWGRIGYDNYLLYQTSRDSKVLVGVFYGIGMALLSAAGFAAMLDRRRHWLTWVPPKVAKLQSLVDDLERQLETTQLELRAQMEQVHSTTTPVKE